MFIIQLLSLSITVTKNIAFMNQFQTLRKHWILFSYTPNKNEIKNEIQINSHVQISLRLSNIHRHIVQNNSVLRNHLTQRI